MVDTSKEYVAWVASVWKANMETQKDLKNISDLLKAADLLADLVEEGECPWIESTRSYRDFWQERKDAAVAYRKLKANYKESNG